MDNFFIMPDGQVIYVENHTDNPTLDDRRDVIKYTESCNMWINKSRATPEQVRKANRLAEKYDLLYIDDEY